MSYYSFRQIIGTIGLVCWPMIAQSALATSATNDSLIILEADGKSYTVQHTIASDGPLIVLDIPADATLRQLNFLGPNQDVLRENKPQSDSPVQLWDGVALVRYQHEYKDELIQTGPNSYRLSIPSLPQNFAVENGDISRSSYTWVFPENIELTSYSAVSDDMGSWRFKDNELAYEQTDRFAVTLSIEFKVRETAQVAAAALPLSTDTFCVPTAGNDDQCASDSDADTVPDYRDVCLDQKVQDDNVKQTAPNDLANTEQISDWQRLFGCAGNTHLILNDVQFPSGYSYLDVDSRKSLDRVAKAIQTIDKHFEIGAHTDNKGDEATNLSLAKKRAETVRYYLLLRGVDPNQIRAKGYGEKFPIVENTTLEGQRLNRRIEITEVQ